MKILFLTPNASRGGSEMMLYYLISNFDHEKFEGILYAEDKGELVDDFSALIPTFCSGIKHTTSFRVKNKLHQILFNESINEKLLTRIHKKFSPDIWYFNTMALTKYADLVERLKVPYVIHFHELNSVYDRALGNQFGKLVTNAKMLIGCSEAVCDQLNGLDHPNVVKFNEIVKLDRIKANQDKRIAIRKTMGIKPGDFVWLMSGATSHRKGFDFFPEIMKYFPEKSIHLVWLGRDRNTGYVYATKKKVNKYFASNIHFVNEKRDDYYEYLNIADGFLLTSREDPFPLVMIEAAYLQKPIAAYDSGGVSEFVKQGMGVIVEKFDHAGMAAGMRKIMDNEIVIDRTLLKSRAEEFDAARQQSNWERIMMDCFQKKNKPVPESVT